MGAAMMCDNEDGNPGTLLVSNLDNGDTFCVCSTCLPTWITALADAIVGTVPATDEGEAEVPAGTIPPPEAVAANGADAPFREADEDPPPATAPPARKGKASTATAKPE